MILQTLHNLNKRTILCYTHNTIKVNDKKINEYKRRSAKHAATKHRSNLYLYNIHYFQLFKSQICVLRVKKVGECWFTCSHNIIYYIIADS